ncbi:MAG: HAD family hydrolase [Nitrososphaeria archaeon]
MLINENIDQGNANKYKAILFIDLDGTLVDFPFRKTVMPFVYEKISKKAGIPVKKVRHLIVEEENKREILIRNDRYDWDDITRTVARRLGIEWTHSLVKIIEESNLSKEFVYPESKPTLEQLIRKGYLLYAATNGFYRYQNPVLEKLKLKQYFKAIITPDTVGHYKNEIGYFKPFLIDGLTPVMIGDEYVYDVVYPKRFGLKTVWINKPKKSIWNVDEVSKVDISTEKPDMTIRSIEELPKAIETIIRLLQ